MPAPTLPPQAALSVDAIPDATASAAPQPPSAEPIARQLQQQLSRALAPFAQQRVIVALSGGLDSMVLLDVLARLQHNASWSLHAVYVHHGLQAVNDDWLSFCQQQCQSRHVAFSCHYLQLQLQQNIEAQARDARYAVLEAYTLEQPSVVLTAHHADDQLETVLLALKRGSGLTGLCGIAAQKNFGAGYLLRPLLMFSRAQLEAYAAHVELAYVTDPSNLDLHFDRNFMRHRVVAPLKQRFPAIAQTAARSMAHLADIEQQQQRLIAAVAAPCMVTTASGVRLTVSKLLALDPMLQPLVLRYFLSQHQLQLSQQQLQQLQRDVLVAAPDRQPQFRLGNTEIRRYADALYCLSGPALRSWHVEPKTIDFWLEMSAGDSSSRSEAVVSGANSVDATTAMHHLVMTQDGQIRKIPLPWPTTLPLVLPLDCYQHQDWPALTLMLIPKHAGPSDATIGENAAAIGPDALSALARTAPFDTGQDVASQQSTNDAIEPWSWLPLSSAHRYRLGPVARQVPFKPAVMPRSASSLSAATPRRPIQQWYKHWQVPVWQRSAVLGLWQDEQLWQLWPLTTRTAHTVDVHALLKSARGDHALIENARGLNAENMSDIAHGLSSAMAIAGDHMPSTKSQPYTVCLGWRADVAERFDAIWCDAEEC